MGLRTHIAAVTLLLLSGCGTAQTVTPPLTRASDSHSSLLTSSPSSSTGHSEISVVPTENPSSRSSADPTTIPPTVMTPNAIPKLSSTSKPSDLPPLPARPLSAGLGSGPSKAQIANVERQVYDLKAAVGDEALETGRQQGVDIHVAATLHVPLPVSIADQPTHELPPSATAVRITCHTDAGQAFSRFNRTVGEAFGDIQTDVTENYSELALPQYGVTELLERCAVDGISIPWAVFSQTKDQLTPLGPATLEVGLGAGAAALRGANVSFAPASISRYRNQHELKQFT